MSERQGENLDRKIQAGIAQNSTQARPPLETLRKNFASLVKRLTPEVEPATVFSLRPLSKDEPR